jgi:hypothetical protein
LPDYLINFFNFFILIFDISLLFFPHNLAQPCGKNNLGCFEKTPGLPALAGEIRVTSDDLCTAISRKEKIISQRILVLPCLTRGNEKNLSRDNLKLEKE